VPPCRPQCWAAALGKAEWPLGLACFGSAFPVLSFQQDQALLHQAAGGGDRPRQQGCWDPASGLKPNPGPHRGRSAGQLLAGKAGGLTSMKPAPPQAMPTAANPNGPQEVLASGSWSTRGKGVPAGLSPLGLQRPTELSWGTLLAESWVSESVSLPTTICHWATARLVAGALIRDLTANRRRTGAAVRSERAAKACASTVLGQWHRWKDAAIDWPQLQKNCRPIAGIEAHAAAGGGSWDTNRGERTPWARPSRPPAATAATQRCPSGPFLEHPGRGTHQHAAKGPYAVG